LISTKGFIERFLLGRLIFLRLWTFLCLLQGRENIGPVGATGCQDDATSNETSDQQTMMQWRVRVDRTIAWHWGSAGDNYSLRAG
jgi:hypothetical protein